MNILLDSGKINWKYFSSNKLAAAFITKDHPYDWTLLSENKAVALKYILQHKGLPWDWKTLARRSDINYEFIMANRHNKKFMSEYHHIKMLRGFSRFYSSGNVEVPTFDSYEHFLKNHFGGGDFISLFDERDSYFLLYKYKNIYEFANLYTNIERICPFNAIDYLSQSRLICLADILDNKKIKWNWKFVSINPNITPAIIANNLNLPWDWDSISLNSFNRMPLKQFCKTGKYKKVYNVKQRTCLNESNIRLQYLLEPPPKNHFLN